MVDKDLHTHLENLKLGDPASFRWVYDQFSARVYHFCLSFTKCPEDAEEITSDVFLRIWDKRSIIDPSVSLYPLLLKITRDLTWNYLRRKSRSGEQKVFLENYRNVVVQSSSDDLIYHEYREMMERALQKLTPQQQKIFTLRYLTGKDLSQISEELKISKNTVKVHLAKSRRLIMHYLPFLTTS